MNDRPSKLYLISEGPNGPVKIGVSDGPDGRMSSLQSGNCRVLYLEKSWPLASRTEAFRAERELHDLLSPHAALGEWFNLHRDDALTYVEGYMRGVIPGTRAA